eukprot:747637-Hanusia_phi.AAC.4
MKNRHSRNLRPNLVFQTDHCFQNSQFAIFLVLVLSSHFKHSCEGLQIAEAVEVLQRSRQNLPERWRNLLLKIMRAVHISQLLDFLVLLTVQTAVGVKFTYKQSNFR